MHCIIAALAAGLPGYFFHRLCLLTCFSCISTAAWSQQGNNWYFGNGAGMTFNTNPPSALHDGQMNTFEGCAAISDDNGQLLFYTDGLSIWNRRHQVMPNGTGLKGHPSSSNAAIVIPKPGSATSYYLFTAGAVEDGNNGYYFSEVDMSLRGGLGDVTTTKNVLLYAPSTEKLTAARHSNGVDIWIITKGLDDAAWNVFKVDCNGVNTVPVVSNVAQLPFGSVGVNVGCVKVSPDGTKIAAANTGEYQWELYRFDASTGILSDGLMIPTVEWPYGMEFSPDSKSLYVGIELLARPVNGGIYQYSLDTWDTTAIRASQTLIGNLTDYVGALQLGPDNKIYCVTEFSDKLAVINSPNQRGAACGFANGQVDLGGKFVFRGLPVFFNNLIVNKNADFDFTIGNDCATIDFTARTSITGNVTWQWDFGDGTSATGQNVTHIYGGSGAKTDSVRLTVRSTGSCGTATVMKTISIKRVIPTARFEVSKQCGNLSVNFYDSSLTTGNPIQNWLWQFGDGVTSNNQHPVHTFAGYGRHTVKLSIGTPGGCNELTTIQKDIVIEPRPSGDFTATKACAGAPVSFTDKSSIVSGNITQWRWEFGDGTVSVLQHPQKTFGTAGVYDVRLIAQSTAGCGPDTITRKVIVEAVPVVAFTNTGACIDKQVRFTNETILSFGTIASYEWSFGEGTVSTLEDPDHRYNRYGDYTTTLKAVTANGCTSSASKVFHIAPPDAFAGNDTTIALGQPLQLIASGGMQYEWSPPDFLDKDNVFNPVAILEKDQHYRVKVITADGCIGEDDIFIHVIKGPNVYVPNAFSPDGKNKLFRPVMAGIQELYFFTVYNRWGQQVFSTRETGRGWDGKINGVIQPGSVFTWILKAKDYTGRIITKKGTVLLVRNN
jgi:PKD repeat protein